jgi:putative protein kinase ArgK-like GTPase of G3E family
MVFCAATATILARAITLIESSRTTDRELAERIVEDCLKYSGNSLRVGITGVPGAGKSSVIEVLGSHLIGSCRQKVAVLAIDPSSQLSGGSILGDKTTDGVSRFKRHGLHSAFTIAWIVGRSCAAHARGDALVRGRRIPKHPG